MDGTTNMPSHIFFWSLICARVYARPDVTLNDYNANIFVLISVICFSVQKKCSISVCVKNNGVQLNLALSISKKIWK